MDKAVQWNLGIKLVKEGAMAMRYIRVLQDRASTVVRVLEDDFEERVLHWLRGRQPGNDNIQGRHPIAAGVYGRRFSGVVYSVSRFWRDQRGAAVAEVIIVLATIAMTFAAVMSLSTGRTWLP